MTVSEFTFLAIGLVLGVASGAALIEIIRARPPSRRDVRVTVSQDAVPRRRATTLADDAFVTVGPEPARGGPADRRDVEGPAPLGAVNRRMNVLIQAPRPALTANETRPATGRLIGLPISAGPDPMMTAFRAGGDATERSGAAAARSPQDHAAATTTKLASQAAVALLDPPTTDRPTDAPADAPADGPAATRTHSGPCAEERRLADERCEWASRASKHAGAAADALRLAQHAYESHAAAAKAAADAGSPGSVRSLKEFAQRDFRAASQAATTSDEVEAAARSWLHQINQINREAAGAILRGDQERDTAEAIEQGLEPLAVEADAARGRARMAEAACLAARSAVADCDEQATPDTPSAVRAVPPPAAGADRPGPAEDEALGSALKGDRVLRIFRLLRGDPDAVERLVASLAGDDPDERRRWTVVLDGLVEAIVANAIDGSFLRFPEDHVFWGAYSGEQNREVTRALASLGHRYDGRGGWVEGRIPSPRELSTALAYAGLDPMRLRQRPNEAQIAQLFRTVEVAADEYLADVAGDLTLAEMVEMLGRRADGLVELWNHWGRIRPLLLVET